MRNIDILNEIYITGDSTNELSLYNYIFLELEQDVTTNIESLIISHAEELERNFNCYEFPSLFSAFQQLDEFFKRINPIFSLYNDYQMIVTDYYPYSSLLYINNLHLDYYRLAEVLLHYYSTDAMQTKVLFELFFDMLTPLTHDFDKAVSFVLTKEFDAFLANKQNYRNYVNTTILAISELKQFAQFCKIQTTLFKHYYAKIQAELIINKAELFIDYAFQNNEYQAYKAAADCEMKDFRIYFANYIDKISTSDIEQLQYENLLAYVEELNEKFAEAFRIDQPIALSYLQSNIRRIKQNDMVFQCKCAAGLLAGKMVEEFISNEYALLYIIIVFPFLLCKIDLPLFYQKLAFVDTAAANLCRELEKKTGTIKMKQYELVSCLKYKDEYMIGVGELEYEGQAISIPTVHALLIEGRVAYSEFGELEKILRYECGEIQREIKAGEEIKLLISDEEIVESQEGEEVVQQDDAIFAAIITEYVKKNSPCNEQYIYENFREYPTEKIGNAIESLLDRYIFLNNEQQYEFDE